MYLPPASVLYISNIRIILDILLGLQPFSSPVINKCPNTLIPSRHKCRKPDLKCTTIIKLYAACKLGVKNVLIFYFLKARKLVTIIYISSHNFQLRPPSPPNFLNIVYVWYYSTCWTRLVVVYPCFLLLQSTDYRDRTHEAVSYV